MRPRLLVRLTAPALFAGIAYLLTAEAVEYRRLAADLDDTRRREVALDRAAEELQYDHAARGVLHTRSTDTPTAGRSIVAVEIGVPSPTTDL